jgi:hypothetical protein
MADETKHPAFTESLVFSRQVDQTGSLDVLFAIQDDLLLDPARGDLVIGRSRSPKGQDRRSEQGLRQTRRLPLSIFVP